MRNGGPIIESDAENYELGGEGIQLRDAHDFPKSLLKHLSGGFKRPNRTI